MRSERIKIKDLARMLGVSVSTMHRALHNSSDVSKKTREKVTRLAKELNYEPDAIAQGLVNRQSKLIGIIVPTIQSNYFSRALSGMTDAANEYGFHIIFSQSNESFQQEIAGIKSLVASNVDGLLISVSEETKDKSHLKSINIPVVMYDRVLNDFECTKVIVDEYQGALNAVNYLIKKGCKRIAHIAGPQNLSVCLNRLRGYQDALRNHNLKIDKNLIAETRSFEKNALRSIKKIMSQREYPDGIFLVNDLSAVIALKYLNKSGLKVPNDIQIIGFNDDPVCTMTVPSITSVMQPAYEVGKLAMGLLVQEILTKKSEKKTHKLRTSLIVRKSTR